tara:strand:+ start:119 stop:367 length:249 start_codon:yes stop_codon:yes gene_type:complete
MYDIISALVLGLGLGIIGTAMWLGSKIRELKNIILDKQTISKLLKETLAEKKPKRKYKKPYKKKYGSNDRKKSTRGMKQVKL